MSKFINPRIDFAFKKIFGSDMDQKEEFLAMIKDVEKRSEESFEKGMEKALRKMIESGVSEEDPKNILGVKEALNFRVRRKSRAH